MHRPSIWVWFVGIVLLSNWVSLPAQDNSSSATAQSPNQTRPISDPVTLRRWLENMVWHHAYSRDEILEVTGLTPADLDETLQQFKISPNNKPLAEVDPPLFVLPYPGGRHPRIGFLDGAIQPQRETKLSIFAPWDRTSYVVLDAPEAIWSNLGLTYLAHTHIDTLWTKQGIQLPQLEWQLRDDGSYYIQRTLPNQIHFAVTATPHRDRLAIEMSLTNGTADMLRDLRVQMCAMLRGLKGFDSQTNENKIFRNSLAACRNATGDRWVILGFQPNHRTWGNAPCPCLHSDPKFPDCAPGETQHVHGWLSFYQGTHIDAELSRIEANWQPLQQRSVGLHIIDHETRQPLAARVYMRSATGSWHFAEADAPDGRVMRYEKQNWINANSQEFHTCVSAHPSRLRLPPGQYRLTVERGKEYLPATYDLSIDTPAEAASTATDSATSTLVVPLRRWINLAQRGWYSGDAHVHRPISQLAVPMLADDVNVALPMVYWTTRSELAAAAGDRTHHLDAARPGVLIEVDPTHVIWPKNTEWEIFSVNGQAHTLGALFAINHRTAFPTGIPPVKAVIEQADREQALLDMDKHDWPFALVLPPLLGERLLFELANNHMWRTEFAFDKWSTPADESMQLAKVDGGGERDWIEYTHRTYWCLLNAGYRLAPTAGTATGVHPVPLGYGRVYVQVPGQFEYGRWIEGLRAGRSFVTTGPLVLVDRIDNRLRVQALADSPIERIEWIINGRVEPIQLETQSLGPGEAVSQTLEREFDFETTSWVAVRVWQKSADGRWRFAHSAPYWFDVAGKPIRPTAAEQQFLIRRVEHELARSRSILPADAAAEYETALEQYRRLRAR